MNEPCGPAERQATRRNGGRVANRTGHRAAVLWLALAGASAAGACVASSTANEKAGVREAPALATEKGGPQLWAENCLRCHNSRAPTEYSDAQWDVVMHHMRVRANLTAEEHEKILTFLKASN